MSILTRLREIEELPTLPEVMVKVHGLINSDECDASKLAKIIKHDPALTSTILKTANSSYYNIINRRISSVTEAIARIGFNEVLKITMAMSVIKKFANTKSIIGYKSFWRHSLTAASMTSIIADMAKSDCLGEDRQDLFLTGLLHDIGVLIYDQFFHDEFTRIIDFALKEEKTYLYSENVISPKETHAFIGGALLEIWKLTSPVINAVRYHHTPHKCSEKLRGIVAVVSLAEYVLCNGHLGSFEGNITDMDENVWEITGLSPEDTNTLYVKAEEEAGKTDVLLNFSHTPREYRETYPQRDTDQFQLRKI